MERGVLDKNCTEIVRFGGGTLDGNESEGVSTFAGA